MALLECVRLLRMGNGSIEHCVLPQLLACESSTQAQRGCSSCRFGCATSQTQQLLALFGLRSTTQQATSSSYTLASPQPYMLVSALATGAWPPFGELYCGCAVRRFRQHATTQTSSGTRFVKSTPWQLVVTMPLLTAKPNPGARCCSY